MAIAALNQTSTTACYGRKPFLFPQRVITKKKKKKSSLYDNKKEKISLRPKIKILFLWESKILYRAVFEVL